MTDPTGTKPDPFMQQILDHLHKRVGMKDAGALPLPSLPLGSAIIVGPVPSVTGLPPGIVPAPILVVGSPPCELYARDVTGDQKTHDGAIADAIRRLAAETIEPWIPTRKAPMAGTNRPVRRGRQGKRD